MNTPNPLPQKAVVVYYDYEPLFLYPCVAKRFGLVDGRHLSWSLMTNVVRENAAHWHLLYIASHKERIN